MHAQWGDIATWAGAVGTVLAVSVALYQVRSERRARQAAIDQAVEQEHRSQAASVSAWYSHDVKRAEQRPVSVHAILNASNEPVYEVVVTTVFVQGAGPQQGEDWHALDPYTRHRGVFAIIPPGTWMVEVPQDWRGMQRRIGAEIAFTDRSESSWIRRATGQLAEIPMNAVDYYGMSRPVSYWPPLAYTDRS